jgi:nucleoside-diphosphate-sugar epimerase
MNVIVVGGAGRVGRMILGPLSTRHRLTVVDPAAESLAGTVHADLVTASCLDHGAIQAASAGQDALIYLAMGVQVPVRRDGTDAVSHFDVSVKGLYLTLHAAAGAGVRRIVYASSLSVFANYLQHGHSLQDREPDAVDGYGLTKRLAEQVGRAAAIEHRMSVVALRLCGPLPDDEWRTFRGRCPAVMTAGSDVAEAFRLALERSTPGFEPFVVTGDHEQRHIDWSRTKERLGWEPSMRRTDG